MRIQYAPLQVTLEWRYQQTVETIGVDLDQAPSNTRAARIVTDPKNEWVPQQVQILVIGKSS